MNSRIVNTSSGPLGLPYPFRGVLSPGQGVTVGATVAQVLAALGGAEAFGLDIQESTDAGHAVYSGDIATAPVGAGTTAGNGAATTAATALAVAAGSVGQAALASGLGAIQKSTATLAFAALAALGAGVKTKSVPLGAALPTGSRIVGYSIDAMTGFDDATHGNFGVEVGVAGSNDVMATTSVKAGATAAPKTGTAASLGYLGAPAVGTPTMLLTGSVDLNTTTAGSVTVTLLWVAPTP
jgi:hypothetical protein